MTSRELFAFSRFAPAAGVFNDPGQAVFLIWFIPAPKRNNHHW
jgi:hypothetical protein